MKKGQIIHTHMDRKVGVWRSVPTLMEGTNCSSNPEIQHVYFYTSQLRDRFIVSRWTGKQG